MERLPTPGGQQAQAGAAPEPARTTTATATVDEQGIVTGWSEGARRLLGYVSSEVVGHEAAWLLADDVGERARRVAAGQQRWSGTVALRHRDGHRLERRLLVHPRTAGGPVAEWLVVSAVPGEPPTPGEETLGEWAFHQSPCILAVFDTRLRLVRANAGMERALALTEDEMRGLRLAEIAPHPASDQVEARMRLALSSGKVQHVRAGIRPPGAGAEHGWSVSLAVLDDAHGRARGVCLAAHDMVPGQLARQRMALLNDKARIGTTADARRTAQELVDVAVPALADFAAVELLDAVRHGDGMPPAVPAGPVSMGRVAVRSILGDGPVSSYAAAGPVRHPATSPVARCLSQGRGAVYEVSDPAIARWAQEDPQAAWIRQAGMHSVMVVPMRAKGATLGVALFGRHTRPESFEADDVWLAKELTAQAAMSIHSARRPAREHTTTMTLQRSLLPQTLPDQRALDIATRYLPAGGRAGVGGDWFDVIPLSGTRVALVVADVVGHGIRASATMGRVRT
ncbi:MAG TPA: PAS domain-containing protein, partial [Pseudonocardiaceae bacterium]|nr:PAS domain-containing protein [Pseudonocardiaceae bacterium]